MQLVLWITFALLISVTCSRRLWVPIAVVILSTMTVPAIAGGVLVGAGLPNLSGIYPSTYFIAALFATQVLLRMADYVRDLAHSVLLVLSLALFIGAALIATYFITGLSGLSFLLNQVVAPVALFAVIRRCLADQPTAGPLLARTVIAGAVVQCAVAISVSTGLIVQPFAESYESYYWFTEEFTRSLGTTDHPLVLSTLLVLAITLLGVVKNTALRAGLAMLFLAVIFMTESRTGLFLSIIAVGFLLVRGGGSLQSRLLLLVGLVGAGVFSLNTALTEGLTEKLTDDGGSGAVRGIAIDYVLGRVNEFAVLGLGPGANVQFARDAGLGTSLENPFLVYAIDYGAAFALLYFGTQALIPLVGRTTPRTAPGYRLGALLVLVAVQTFSSVATSNSLGLFVWMALAFAAKPLLESASPDPQPAPPVRRVSAVPRNRPGRAKAIRLADRSR